MELLKNMRVNPPDRSLILNIRGVCTFVTTNNKKKRQQTGFKELVTQPFCRLLKASLLSFIRAVFVTKRYVLGIPIPSCVLQECYTLYCSRTNKFSAQNLKRNSHPPPLQEDNNDRPYTHDIFFKTRNLMLSNMTWL